MTFTMNNDYSPTQLFSSTSHSKTRMSGWSYSNANFVLKLLAHSAPIRDNTVMAVAHLVFEMETECVLCKVRSKVLTLSHDRIRSNLV